MKKVANHLSSVLLTLAAIGACIGVLTVSAPTVSGFFGSVVDTDTVQVTEIVESIETPRLFGNNAGVTPAPDPEPAPDPIPEPAAGEQYEDGCYVYLYNAFRAGPGFTMNDESIGGWNVVDVKDDTLTSYPDIPATVCGWPVVRSTDTFFGCTNLTTAPGIPNTMTSMLGTFSGCSSLKTPPELPNGLKIMNNTFVNCTSLETPPSIPASVTDMTSVFQNCSSLTTAPVIPNGVTTLEGAFSNCSSLITAPVIPNGVTKMVGTFSGCSSLKTYVGSSDADGDFSNYVIPDSVTAMNNTFYGCTLLTAAPVIPDGVTYMMGTFYNCTALAGEVVIPDGVIRLDNIFALTEQSITMKYYSSCTAAEEYEAPTNVTKLTIS